MNLVKENDGFEFVIGFKGNVDHSIGGQGNKYWYYVDHNGKKAEYYVGTYENGTWTDKFYTAKGSKLTEKTVESGTTIKKIVERAYFYQEKIGQRKGKELEKYGYPCLHYVYGFVSWFKCRKTKRKLITQTKKREDLKDEKKQTGMRTYGNRNDAEPCSLR
ncbi:MAG: hypothetical protein J6U66_02305 [Lachnospiraceae bacterium]|nr:hypothetical protein [Lachnospiraceae bacterium]